MSLRTDVADQVPARVRTDHLRLRQVLVNLIGNAVKFTREGEISIRTLLSGNDARLLSIEVQDTGPGMDEETTQSLFVPFKMGTSSNQTSTPGTGLGLAIARRLTQALGGTLEFETKLGRGTTFRLSLPLVLGEVQDASSERALEPKPQEPSAKRHRILLAEDNPVNQLLIKTLMTREGYDIDLVDNGQMMLDRLASNACHYDLVLLDLHMPVLDGFQAIEALRRTKNTIPVVALTANAMNADRERAEQLGFDGFETKPIERRRLLSTIRRLTEGKILPL